MRRRFTSQQLQALYIASDGVCAICHKPLGSDWQGDHIQPYSRGGATDVLNGQAVHRLCNLRKGNRLMNTGLPAWSLDLREWQIQAEWQYQQSNSRNFLCASSTGAGKTMFGVRIAWIHLWQGTVERIVVVVPYETLKRSWSEKLAGVGIHVEYDFSNRNPEGKEAGDMHGVVVTYQQVASAPEMFRVACRRTTLVIFDEPHHAAMVKDKWGDYLKRAFDPASYRLLLTGTPFRSDGCPMPYVHYDTEGKCVPDFSYTYGDALRDGVCRPVQFPTFAGEVTWDDGHQEQRRDLGDDLTDEESSRALRTALDPAGDWLPEVLQAAHRKLLEVREAYYARAGGIVVARDQSHAKEIVRLLRRVTGEDPAIAISEDDDAVHVINAFRDSDRKWIVSVKMVSEGVDIPRLFVGVYATNVTTELFFIQVVGRCLRMMAGVEDQVASWFFPNIRCLVEYMKRIKMQVVHILQSLDDEEPAKATSGVGATPTTNGWRPLGSRAEEAETVFDHDCYPPDLMAEARQIRAETGFYKLEDAEFARLILAVREKAVAPSRSTVSTPGQLRTDEKKSEATKARRKTGILVGLVPLDWEEINRLLARASGTKRQGATLAQLQYRTAVLDQWIEKARRGEAPAAYSDWERIADDARQHAPRE